MKIKYLIIILAAVLSFTSVTLHKYYVSITEIEYIEEKKSVQIISRIFIDDFQRLLRGRFDDKITLDDGQDEGKIDTFINQYLKSRLKVSINNKAKDLVFIGKEYDTDIVYCYYEITGVEALNQFEIENTVLFDMFDEQKNVVRTNFKNAPKTFILIPENNKGLLNFK